MAISLFMVGAAFQFQWSGSIILIFILEEVSEIIAETLILFVPNKTEEENLYIPKCMDMIKLNHVIEAIESYYPDGI
jgi:2-phospho-L-lactate transferase/gluconeogenesis factor (CofD/UPF0052 family)